MNIILVDDEVKTVDIVSKALNWNKIGIQRVYTAYNAGEAREILLTNEIDITLCDIEMPKESGLELIHWIQDMFPRMVNIILTGFPDFNYARSAISLGVYEYLLKPVSFSELEQTIAAVVQKLEQDKINQTQQRSEAQVDDITVVEKVKYYIERHFCETITRNDIENLVHLNRDYINREFKQVTGYTLMEYIQYYRILTAKKLLRDSDKSITEICTQTGYDSPAYFSKIFKRQTDITPIEYRGKYRSK